mmetsp:Transcript_69457/g.166503  ORF Transcript_69457/g.166503 Transcript_69457/m.166503 type:complete len:221 (+) Transcript_69457:96-758(+)
MPRIVQSLTEDLRALGHEQSGEALALLPHAPLALGKRLRAFALDELATAVPSKWRQAHTSFLDSRAAAGAEHSECSGKQFLPQVMSSVVVGAGSSASSRATGLLGNRIWMGPTPAASTSFADSEPSVEDRLEDVESQLEGMMSGSMTIMVDLLLLGLTVFAVARGEVLKRRVDVLSEQANRHRHPANPAPAPAPTAPAGPPQPAPQPAEPPAVVLHADPV